MNEVLKECLASPEHEAIFPATVNRHSSLMLFDLALLVFFALLLGPPIGIAVSLGRMFIEVWPWWVLWFTWPAFAVLAVLLVLVMAWAIRSALPPLVPGRHVFPGSWMAWVWMAKFAIQRVLYFPGLSHFYFYFTSLRFLLLRVLGGTIPLDMMASSDASLLDVELMHLGRGVMLATGTLATCHMVRDNELWLGTITLAENVQLFWGARIGPEVHVGAHSTLGVETKLVADVKVGHHVRLGIGCVCLPGCRIGDHAVVGHQALLEHDVHVGAHAVVQPGTRVPRGTHVLAHETYPPQARPSASAAI